MTKKQTDKRGAILTATLELIAENGFHGTPTSMIAERASIGVGSIYRYFKDKDELIHALHHEMEGRLKQALLRDYKPDAPIRERFLHLCANLFHFFLNNPKEFLFLEQYFNSPYGIAKRREKLLAELPSDELDDPLRNTFETGKAQQIIKDLPQSTLCAITFGPMLLMIRDHISGFIALDDAKVREAIEACWDALKR